jgi:hypothetical protein
MPRQVPGAGFGEEGRVVERIEEFPEAGGAEDVVPGQERPGRRLVGALPRADPHRLTVTAAAAPPAGCGTTPGYGPA